MCDVGICVSVVGGWGLLGFSGELFQHLPNLIQATGHVETALPLAALEGEEHFAAAIEVAKPFGVRGVGKVGPHIVVDALKPSQTLLVAL